MFWFWMSPDFINYCTVTMKQSAHPRTLQEYQSISEMSIEGLDLEYVRQSSFQDNTQFYYQRLADSYFLEKQYQLAAEYYFKALPDSLPALDFQGWGSHEFKIGNYENLTAEWYIQQILQNKHCENPLNALSLSLSQIEEFEYAIRMAERLISKFQNYPDLHSLKGHIYYNFNYLKEAEEQYLKVQTGSWVSNTGRGFLELRKGNFQRSFQFFNQSATAKPNPYAYMGLALTTQSNSDRKIFCKKAMELLPHYCRAMYILGRCFCTEKEYGEAKKCYRAAIEANPYFDEAYTEFGKVILKNKQNMPLTFSTRHVITLETNQTLPSVEKMNNEKEVSIECGEGSEKKRLINEINSKIQREKVQNLQKICRLISQTNNVKHTDELNQQIINLQKQRENISDQIQSFLKILSYPTSHASVKKKQQNPIHNLSVLKQAILYKLEENKKQITARDDLLEALNCEIMLVKKQTEEKQEAMSSIKKIINEVKEGLVQYQRRIKIVEKNHVREKIQKQRLIEKIEDLQKKLNSFEFECEPQYPSQSSFVAGNKGQISEIINQDQQGENDTSIDQEREKISSKIEFEYNQNEIKMTEKEPSNIDDYEVEGNGSELIILKDQIKMRKIESASIKNTIELHRDKINFLITKYKRLRQKFIVERKEKTVLKENSRELISQLRKQRKQCLNLKSENERLEKIEGDYKRIYEECLEYRRVFERMANEKDERNFETPEKCKGPLDFEELSKKKMELEDELSNQKKECENLADECGRLERRLNEVEKLLEERDQCLEGLRKQIQDYHKFFDKNDRLRKAFEGHISENI